MRSWAAGRGYMGLVTSKPKGPVRSRCGGFYFTEETMNDRIQRAFEEFHRKNPTVYQHLRTLALRYYKAGRKVGIKHLWEVMRWHEFTGQLMIDGEYKLNNNFTSRYARLLMEKEPVLDGYFETRRLWPEPLDRREVG